MESAQGGSTSLIVQMNTKFFPDLTEHVIYGEPVALPQLSLTWYVLIVPNLQTTYSRVIRYFKPVQESSGISISATSFLSLQTLLSMSA